MANRILHQNKGLRFRLPPGRWSSSSSIAQIQNCRGCAILPQALKCIRDVGFAQTDDEAREEENRAMMHRSRPKRLYPSLGV